MPNYLSGRSKRTPQSALKDERYRYLSAADAEPNFGDPTAPGDSPPFGQQYQIVSVEGHPGERYWVPITGGLIPGSISVFDEGNLRGGLSSTTQLNFTGLAITAYGSNTGLPNPGIAVTIQVFAPGNDQEILFNTANDFSTSSKLSFDNSSGLLRAGDRIQVGIGGTVISTSGVGSVGIGTTNPSQKLHVQGDVKITGTIYDYFNNPGSPSFLIAKNNFGGLSWTDPSIVRSGAGGVYQSVQYHNSVGLVDGASNFIYDEVNQRVGIGTTTPEGVLDVCGQVILSPTDRPTATIYAKSTSSGLVIRGGNDSSGIPSPDNPGANIELYGKDHPLYASKAFYDADTHRFRSKNVDEIFLSISSNVGVGITFPTDKLDVNGDVRLRNGIKDNNNTLGTTNSILTSTGSGVIWSSPSSIVGLATTSTPQFAAIGLGVTAQSGFEMALAGSGILLRQSVVAVGSTYTIDITSGNEFVTSAAINGATTINLSNLASLPTNYVWEGVLTFSYNSGVISWFSGNSGYSVKWDGGIAIIPTSGETETLVIRVVGGVTNIEVYASSGRS
jgi:hypothetical protein